MARFTWFCPSLGAGLLVALTVGCTGDSESEFAEFVGSWEYMTGSEEEQCPMEAKVTTDLKNSVLELKEGTDAPVVIVGGSCVLRFDVNGSTATVRANQRCSQSIEDTDPDPMSNLGVVTITRAIESFTFTVNGLMATESSKSKLTFMSSRAQGALECSITTTGSLRKVAK
jgi:hypothetical protein